MRCPQITTVPLELSPLAEMCEVSGLPIIEGLLYFAYMFCTNPNGILGRVMLKKQRSRRCSRVISFEALGSAKPNSPDTGFRTYGTLLAYGVNAQGVHVGSKHGAGVYAELMLQSPGASRVAGQKSLWSVGHWRPLRRLRRKRSPLWRRRATAPDDKTPICRQTWSQIHTQTPPAPLAALVLLERA